MGGPKTAKNVGHHLCTFPNTVYGLDQLLQYLGVDPCIGFSMARFIMAAVTRVKSNQSPINRHHKFFSESNRGIDHIPINVQNCKKDGQNGLDFPKNLQKSLKIANKKQKLAKMANKIPNTSVKATRESTTSQSMQVR